MYKVSLYTSNIIMHFYVWFIEPDVNVDDLVLVDGDILLSKEQAAIYYESGWGGLVKSESWKPDTNKWDTRIPYHIDSSLTATAKTDPKIGAIFKNVVDSVQEITSKTCISIEYKNCRDKTYIKFEKDEK